MEKILEELRKFEKTEHIFGDDFINSITYEEKGKYEYIIKIKDCFNIVLEKYNSFTDNYLYLIERLVECKNQTHECDTVTCYYHDWLIFQKEYICTIAEFYAQNFKTESERDRFIFNKLGELNFCITEGITHARIQRYRWHMNELFVYLGGISAMSYLVYEAMDNDVEDRLFMRSFDYWWRLLPVFLTNQCDGELLYDIGTEMKMLKNCSYDYQSENHLKLYETLIHHIVDATNLDIKEKEQLIQQIYNDYLHYRERRLGNFK